MALPPWPARFPSGVHPRPAEFPAAAPPRAPLSAWSHQAVPIFRAPRPSVHFSVARYSCSKSVRGRSESGHADSGPFVTSRPARRHTPAVAVAPARRDVPAPQSAFQWLDFAELLVAPAMPLIRRPCFAVFAADPTQNAPPFVIPVLWRRGADFVSENLFPVRGCANVPRQDSALPKQHHRSQHLAPGQYKSTTWRSAWQSP